jgi:propionate CoA-transferase
MQIITSRQAADLLEDGMTIAASGFGGCCHPEAITAAVEARFLDTSKPRDLTLLFAASTGDRKTRGMGHFGHEGLVKRVIAGGWRGTPRLGALALEEKIEAHCWPTTVASSEKTCLSP